MKIMTATLSFGLLALASAAAFAGVADSVPVEVVVNPDGSGYARGDMVSARTSTSEFELIGCGLRAINQFLPMVAFCQAANADGTFAICVATKPNTAEVIKAISAYSYIRFEFDAKGECTQIYLSTQSVYLPSNVTGN